MVERDLLLRSRNFAYNVYSVLKKIKSDNYNRQIIDQLLDSSFSAAANYRSSQRAKSKKDAINKIKIALEEIDESNFWLQSIFDLKIYSTSESAQLIRESSELTAIFVAILKKLEE